jgi:hypothetical protein
MGPCQVGAGRFRGDGVEVVDSSAMSHTRFEPENVRAPGLCKLG